MMRGFVVSYGEMSWNEDFSDPVTHCKLLFSSDIEEDIVEVLKMKL